MLDRRARHPFAYLFPEPKYTGKEPYSPELEELMDEVAPRRSRRSSCDKEQPHDGRPAGEE